MTLHEAKALAAALVPPEHVDVVAWELMRVYELGHAAGREEILWREDLVYRKVESWREGERAAIRGEFEEESV